MILRSLFESPQTLAIGAIGAAAVSTCVATKLKSRQQELRNQMQRAFNAAHLSPSYQNTTQRSTALAANGVHLCKQGLLNTYVGGSLVGASIFFKQRSFALISGVVAFAGACRSVAGLCQAYWALTVQKEAIRQENARINPRNLVV